METTELVKLASTGNISEFSSAVSAAVLDRLKEKIENYQTEIGAQLSAAPVVDEDD